MGVCRVAQDHSVACTVEAADLSSVAGWAFTHYYYNVDLKDKKKKIPGGKVGKVLKRVLQMGQVFYRWGNCNQTKSLDFCP